MAFIVVHIWQLQLFMYGNCSSSHTATLVNATWPLHRNAYYSSQAHGKYCTSRMADIFCKLHLVVIALANWVLHCADPGVTIFSTYMANVSRLGMASETLITWQTCQHEHGKSFLQCPHAKMHPQPHSKHTLFFPFP